MMARRLGVPHVVHLHYTPGPWLTRPTLERLKTCEKVLAISRFIGKLAEEQGVSPGRLTVLPNSIDLTSTEPGSRAPRGDRLKVGQIGRLVAGKGFEDSVRAFAKVVAEVPTAELVLVGEGSERRRIEALVQQLGLEGRVQFTGWQSDVRKWLSSFDVFITPSRSEPFGLVALEASAAGLPVVAYDEGGTAESSFTGRPVSWRRPVMARLWRRLSCACAKTKSYGPAWVAQGATERPWRSTLAMLVARFRTCSARSPRGELSAISVTA